MVGRREHLPYGRRVMNAGELLSELHLPFSLLLLLSQSAVYRGVFGDPDFSF